MEGQCWKFAAKYRGDAWRVVYTVEFEEATYVLHAFQKKAKRGISTPKTEIDLVKQRLKIAEQLHGERQN